MIGCTMRVGEPVVRAEQSAPGVRTAGFVLPSNHRAPPPATTDNATRVRGLKQ